MKKWLILATSLIFTACSTTQNNAPAATAKLGTVSEKETIVKQVTQRSPVDIGVGIGGGGHVGWGINFGLGQLINLMGSTSNTMVYQYKIKMATNDTLVMQSAQDLSVGSCLTVWTLIGDSNYPKIEANPDCKLPLSVK